MAPDTSERSTALAATKTIFFTFCPCTFADVMSLPPQHAESAPPSKRGYSASWEEWTKNGTALGVTLCSLFAFGKLRETSEVLGTSRPGATGIGERTRLHIPRGTWLTPMAM